MESISNRRDFHEVFATGTRGRRGPLTVHTRPRPDRAAPTRLGLAVRTAAGGAVERNRAKRRLRAAFATCAPPAGLDVVVVADEQVNAIRFEELVEDLKFTLEAARRA
jgi:ribonuclease P protein component